MLKKYDFEHKVNRGDEGLLLKGLLKRERGMSTRLMRRMRYGEGSIFLNGKPARLIDPVTEGDFIQINFPVEQSFFEPENIPIDVIYEDDYFLGINKQPGLVVHPTKGHANHTLANGVMYYMSSKGENYKIRFINRLDMDTSGIVLIGKNPHVQNHFTNQSNKGGIKKIYQTIVCGIIGEERGTIDVPIGKIQDNQIKRTVRADGRPSISEYKVKERFPRGYTQVELALVTGRTHQIRVHMAFLGHPVVGDELYGGARPWLAGRQALHAERLVFKHPMTGEQINLRARFPDDMKKIIQKLSQDKRVPLSDGC